MNDEQVKISVVMPVYNAINHLENSIASVLEQTFTEFEFIVVDDGSSDGSEKKLRIWSQRDPRIRLFLLKTNRGVSAARNHGIQQASAQLVALIDADDTWMPTKLAVQYRFHQETQCPFSCTAYTFAGVVISGKPILGYRDLLFNNVINTSTVLVDKSEIDLTFTSSEKAEDYLEWLKIVKNFPIHLIDLPLATRNIVAGESSNKLRMATRRWVIYRQIEKLPLSVSIYCFIGYFISGLRKHWRTTLHWNQRV